MRIPARTKKGMARSGKLSRAPHNRWGTIIMGVLAIRKRKNIEAKVMASAMGTRRRSRATNTTNKRKAKVITVPPTG